MAKIVFNGGDIDGHEVALTKGEITIGRRDDCDLAISDSRISSHHCKLVLENGAWWIFDTGSSNGTSVNNESVQAVELNDGDGIIIGDTSLTFLASDEPAVDAGGPKLRVSESQLAKAAAAMNAEGAAPSSGLKMPTKDKIHGGLKLPPKPDLSGLKLPPKPDLSGVKLPPKTPVGKPAAAQDERREAPKPAPKQAEPAPAEKSEAQSANGLNLPKKESLPSGLKLPPKPNLSGLNLPKKPDLSGIKLPQKQGIKKPGAENAGEAPAHEPEAAPEQAREPGQINASAPREPEAVRETPVFASEPETAREREERQPEAPEETPVAARGPEQEPEERKPGSASLSAIDKIKSQPKVTPMEEVQRRKAEAKLSTVGKDDVKLIEDLKAIYGQMRKQLSQVIIGQSSVVEEVLIAIFASGHALLVGVPGLAKTLLISTLSTVLDLGFKRVQFTPDLMPSDITGTDVLEEDKTTGKRVFRFVEGPVFANMLLADEINRTPPKTQAALLEAMQEHRVTVGSHSYKLPAPFFVLATQNPIEQEGTYPLPEAQLDRFLFNIVVSYPTSDEESQIIRAVTSGKRHPLDVVLNGEDVLKIQDLVRRVPVADHVIDYARDLVRATRPKQPGVPDFVKEMVGWGAGPRAGISLITAAKARAILHGRVNATTGDVSAVAHPVLRHRVITTFNAEAAGVTSDDIIDMLLKHFKPKKELDI